MYSFIDKYSPTCFDETIYSSTLIETIKLTIKLGNVHLLFVGPQNCGKTTMINCFIREYFELKNGASLPHQNIMFMNIMREQGITYYRTEMKTFCQSKCTIHNKKKLVIIDDIDTIHDSCQHIFRCFMENYKNNVIFICSASCENKIIEQLQSRLCILKLNTPSFDSISGIIKTICNNENMFINNDALSYLINITNKNIRKIITTLEKIYIFNDTFSVIDIELCKKFSLSINDDQLNSYLTNLINKDIVTAYKLLIDLHNVGFSVIDIIECFYTFIKMTNRLDDSVKYKFTIFICEYIVSFYKIHEHPIELIFFTNDILQLL